MSETTTRTTTFGLPAVVALVEQSRPGQLCDWCDCPDVAGALPHPSCTGCDAVATRQVTLDIRGKVHAFDVCEPHLPGVRAFGESAARWVPTG